MKIRLIIALSILLIGLSGCLVKSLHPFYKNSDIAFNNELTGNWMDQEESEWIFSRLEESKGFLKGDTTLDCYLVKIRQKDSVYSEFIVTPFKLNGISYLDFFVRMEESTPDGILRYNLIPVHTIAQLITDSSKKIKIAFYNEEWLNSLIDSNLLKTKYEFIDIEGNSRKDDNQLLLTGSTQELREFLMHFGEDSTAISKDFEKDEYSFILNRKEN